MAMNICVFVVCDDGFDVVVLVGWGVVVFVDCCGLWCVLSC